MSLSYEAALSTLQSMFADQSYTSAHFDAVLRHQGGHMENTVETLLLHGGDSPEELIRKLPTLTPGVPNANNAANNNNQGSIDQDAELARQLAAAEEHAVANNINRRSGQVAAATHVGYELLDQWCNGGRLRNLNSNSNIQSFAASLCEIHGSALKYRCACAIGYAYGELRLGKEWQQWNKQIHSKDECKQTSVEMSWELLNNLTNSDQVFQCSHCQLGKFKRLRA